MTSRLQPTTGPLQTGLYIASSSARNQLGAVRTDGGTNKLEVATGEPDADTAVWTVGTLTSLPDEIFQWFVENLGNDRYRISHRFSGKSYQPDVYVQGASVHQECEPNEWIVKELETKGEYW